MLISMQAAFLVHERGLRILGPAIDLDFGLDRRPKPQDAENKKKLQELDLGLDRRPTQQDSENKKFRSWISDLTAGQPHKMKKTKNFRNWISDLTAGQLHNMRKTKQFRSWISNLTAGQPHEMRRTKNFRSWISELTAGPKRLPTLTGHVGRPISGSDR